jgi:CheY-like chemotaxis protein
MEEIMPAEEIEKHYSIKKWFGNILNKKVTPIGKSKSNIDITSDMTTYIRSLFHDLRGPLNNISLGIDTLLQRFNEETDDYDTLKSVKESCTFLGESLDGFLCINILTPLNINTIKLSYEPFNMIGLIKKIQYISLFSIHDKKINIECKIKPFQEWVIGDYKFIQFAILSLVSNTIKSLKNNSTITIDMFCNRIIDSKKQHIVLEIISDSKRSIYFRSFKSIRLLSSSKSNTSRTNNTQHYLNISKNIIELHDGNIECYDKDGKNIIQFNLFLDICPSSEKEIDKIISSKPLSKASSFKNNPVDLSVNKMQNSLIIPNNQILMMMKRSSQRSLSSNIKTDKDITNIMVIDDSNTSRKLMTKLINNTFNNIKIYDAIDGLDALVKFIKFSDNDIPISMVLVDNVMPNLTGELLSKILRSFGFNGLIIGITANGVKDDIQSFKNNGADYVFIKPFTKNNLLSLNDFIKRCGFLSEENKKIKLLEDGILDWVKY